MDALANGKAHGFGKPGRSLFEFASTYTPLNHGSFGAYPRIVRKVQEEYVKLAQERPDTFIVYDIPELIKESRTAIAPLLGASSEEIVLLPNATTGTNTVLRNLQFQEEDVVVYFSTVYDALEKTLLSIAEITPFKLVSIPLIYPVEDADLLLRFRLTVQAHQAAGQNVKLAIFDTISTFPGVRVPWEALVTACKEMGILSLIDGAHGIGQIDLTHLGAVSPDFFVSNCHKWLYTPRGCAVFYVPLRNQHLIQTSIPTSHGYATPFTNVFEFIGTLDYTPYFCIKAALQFRRDVLGGELSIRTYNEALALEGGKLVAKILGTYTLDNSTNTLTKCSFTNILLPLKFRKLPSASKPNEVDEFHHADGPAIQQWLQRTAVKEFDTYLQIAFYQGAMWVRLSGQVYLDLDDFVWVGGKLALLCERVRKHEMGSLSLDNVQTHGDSS